MKVLLDENLPHQLRHELPGHDCYTVAYMGWSGLENGKLLDSASTEDFDVFVTKDAGVQYEQNLSNLPLAVVILHAPSNDVDDIRRLLPALLHTLTGLTANAITHIPSGRLKG